MMYKKIVLIRLLKAVVCTLVLQIAVAANVYAENVASIVLGSYVNIDNATRCLETFAPQLDLSLQIAEATVHGTKYFRILSNPRDNIGKARVEMQKIKATVAPDAWLLIEPRRDVQHLFTRTDAGSGILHAPADLDKEEQAVDQGKHKQQTDQQPSSLRHSEVGAQVPAQGTTSAVRVGLDATKQPIVLPRYDKVDITIDGRLDESIWSQVPGYDNMAVIQPDTLEAGRYRTETKFLYTDRGFYLGIYNEQPKETLIERLSMRDQYTNRDYIEMSFDPTGEGLYGYYFGVSLGGSLNDGTILPEWVFSKEWDGPWY